MSSGKNPVLLKQIFEWSTWCFAKEWSEYPFCYLRVQEFLLMLFILGGRWDREVSLNAGHVIRYTNHDAMGQLGSITY